MSIDFKIGHGYDVHKLITERKLIIGGVDIPHTHGLLGHSDADVLIHAVMDAVIGALGLGDIGKHFPDNDGKYKDIDSMLLANETYKLLTDNRYTIGNIDCTVIAQKPKLAPYIEQMRNNIAGVYKIPNDRVNVKATTEEGLGFTGSCEGIAAHAVVIIKSCD
jgi:2-C-methyl-D-erythritol 2,4-cyclodiphosphate synthase